ncbi:hypothetical protein FE81_14400, partial [Staphylococcus aureus]
AQGRGQDQRLSEGAVGRVARQMGEGLVPAAGRRLVGLGSRERNLGRRSGDPVSKALGARDPRA